MRSRRIELYCGVLGGVLGLAALALGISFALQVQPLDTLWFAITVFGGPSLGILLFSIWHSQSRNVAAFILLIASTLALMVWTVLGGFSIGLLFIPADLLALAAIVAGIGAASQRAPVHP
jgi:hypothetical protein